MGLRGNLEISWIAGSLPPGFNCSTQGFKVWSNYLIQLHQLLSLVWGKGKSFSISVSGNFDLEK